MEGTENNSRKPEAKGVQLGATVLHVDRGVEPGMVVAIRPAEEEALV